MKTKDAMSRLIYTISKGHKPNEADKIALNSVISYINKVEEETIQENLLFAKLYTFLLSEFLNHYQDIDFANKQINKELALPLDYHIEVLKNKLSMWSLDNFFKSKGIFDPFIIGKPISEAVEKYENNKKLFPKIDTKEFLETIDYWDKDNVVAHLNRNINESLNNFKNV